MDGANARSRGETFLEEHRALLTRLAAATESETNDEERAEALAALCAVSGKARDPEFLAEHEDLLARLSRPGDRPIRPADRMGALAAFDRAGIGREPWSQEASSDLIIRSATTAAAVAATVVDSERSGLTPIKPVTRLLRGVMLLPFWTVTGLTSRSVLARTLAMLALSLGATLLALALFGVLPEGLSGPATAIGLSAVLVAFAYGAMRAGTMLHGLVLLTPVLALVAIAISTARNEKVL